MCGNRKKSEARCPSNCGVDAKRDRTEWGKAEELRCGICAKASDGGFTLLELMLAIAILAVISMVSYLTFSTATSAWKQGMVLSDDLHHGDFVMEQLVMALRSAYYPDAKDKAGAYGMVTEDEGSGEMARDTISWVKLGGVLVGKDSTMAGSPHRVKVSIEDTPDGKPGVAVRAWRLHGQKDTFDPGQVPPVFLSSRVLGFNCRTAYQKKNDEIDWMDEWEETNRLPTVVELTLFLEPLEKDKPPIEVKRVLGIPVAPLSWR